MASSFDIILAFFYLLIFAGILGLGWAFWRSVRLNRERKLRQREYEFVGIIINAFGNKAIKDVPDLIALYDAHFGITQQSIKIYSDLHLLLAKAQLRISTGSGAYSDQRFVERLDEFRQLTNSVEGLLKAERKREPFFGVPDLERGLLEDILELTATDKELVNAKLVRLAELIEARQDTIDVLGEEKGEARKLAYWGLAGSVVFGVMSIILGVGPFLQALNANP